MTKAYTTLIEGEFSGKFMSEDQVLSIRKYANLDLTNDQHIDSSDLFEFIIEDRPEASPYQSINSYYDIDLENRTVTKRHTLVDMSAEEKQAKIDQIKADFSVSGYSLWEFDETSCCFLPPIAMPEPADGETYEWDEDSQSWISS